MIPGKLALAIDHRQAMNLLARHAVKGLVEQVVLADHRQRAVHDRPDDERRRIGAGGDDLVAQVAVGHDAVRQLVFADHDAGNVLLAHDPDDVDQRVVGAAGDHRALAEILHRAKNWPSSAMIGYSLWFDLLLL
jgi:hypothetical protein